MKNTVYRIPYLYYITILCYLILSKIECIVFIMILSRLIFHRSIKMLKNFHVQHYQYETVSNRRLKVENIL